MAQASICAVCGGASCEGMNIGGQYICAACERLMAAAQPGTGEYERFMKALKKLTYPMERLTRAQEDALERELDEYEPMSVDELMKRVGLSACRELHTVAAQAVHARRRAGQRAGAESEAE
ncbi:MAG: sigma factor G inhibitor Gin [Candidatus Fimadaptatus sp.]